MNRRTAATVLSVIGLVAASLVATPAQAYGPSVLYSSPANAQDYGALYPRTVELQHNGAANGTLLATFEKVETFPKFPIYRSTDQGTTWTQISQVNDAVNGWGNRNGAFLYELPQQIGSMPAGTILCIGLSAPADHSAERMEVYKSNDQGRTWQYVSRLASSGGYTTTPIWEPFILVANNKLIVYYSDERDKAHNNQKLVHQVSTDGVNWGPVVNDVAPTDVNLRPGMATVSKMANGQYLMTYEIVNLSGTPNNFKISSNPESWNPTNLGTTIDHGGSPVNMALPDGRILYNSYGSQDAYVNTGNGTGAWTPMHVTAAAGYSRWLQYVHATGRVLIMTCPGFWIGGKNTITYADRDFGSSAGGYYKFVNRKSGKVLGVNAGSFSDGANVVQWADTGAADQAWHVTTRSNGNVVLTDRRSGDALGIWQQQGTDGAGAVQWVDNGAADQQWQLVPTGSYYKIRNVNSGKVLGITGGSTADGAQAVQWTDTGALDQQWQRVQVS